jgi:hypothetical protein
MPSYVKLRSIGLVITDGSKERSPETSVLTRTTQRYLPKDRKRHSHRRGKINPTLS